MAGRNTEHNHLPHQQCWMAARFSPRTFASFLCLCPCVDGSGGGGGDGVPCPGSWLGSHPLWTGSGRVVPDRSLWAWRPGDAVSARTPSALWDWDQQSAEEGKETTRYVKKKGACQCGWGGVTRTSCTGSCRNTHTKQEVDTHIWHNQPPAVDYQPVLLKPTGGCNIWE